MATYKSAPNAKFNNTQAQVIGEALEKLGDSFTPAEVVAKAKPKRSPLHPFFEWDDTTAAHKHRLAQARSMVASVQIVVKCDGASQRTRGFHSVVITSEDNKPVYSPVMRIREEPELSQQVIDAAMRQLKGWKERYGEYQELFGPMLAAIGEVEEQVKAG